jgi:Tetratricopeptide repeat.
MRHFPFARSALLALACLVAGTAAAAAQDPSPDAAKGRTEATAPEAKPAAPKRETLDTLFSDLKRQRDPAEAKRIADRIWARWRDSGSATGNILLQWADRAIAEKKHGLALDLLDQITVLVPDFAEGWNRRATLHFLMGNHDKSMADIDHVLRLEPRHFGALAGMAAIFTASGNDEMALRAWERMLDIYPANREAQKQVGEIADRLAGSRT